MKPDFEEMIEGLLYDREKGVMKEIDKPTVPNEVAVWFEANKENVGKGLMLLGAQAMTSGSISNSKVVQWVSNPINKPVEMLHQMQEGYHTVC